MNFKNIEAAELKQQLSQKDQEPMMLIDIRKQEDFAQGSIAQSINIEPDNIAKHLATTELDQKIVVICYRGRSSQKAAQNLVNAGFKNIFNLVGGYNNWNG